MGTKITSSKPRERISVQLKKIRENKNLNKFEKARAILAIPNEDVIWTDNRYELPFAKREALATLSGNDRNLRDDLKDLINYIKRKGNQYYTKINSYLNKNQNLAQNSK